MIWEGLIKEYFCRNDKGTSKQIANWIWHNKFENVKNHVEEQMAGLRPKSLAEWWLNNPKRIEYHTNALITYQAISPVLARMYKKKKLNRKESNSSNCKYEYFYPTEITSASPTSII